MSLNGGGRSCCDVSENLYSFLFFSSFPSLSACVWLMVELCLKCYLYFCTLSLVGQNPFV